MQVATPKTNIWLCPTRLLNINSGSFITGNKHAHYVVWPSCSSLGSGHCVFRYIHRDIEQVPPCNNEIHPLNICAPRCSRRLRLGGSTLGAHCACILRRRDLRNSQDYRMWPKFELKPYAHSRSVLPLGWSFAIGFWRVPFSIESEAISTLLANIVSFAVRLRHL